jgi:hypothetical protein
MSKSPKKPTPQWTPGNLADHWNKSRMKDRRSGCIDRITAKRNAIKWDYVAESEKQWKKPMVRWKGKHKDLKSSKISETRIYRFSFKGVMVITDIKEKYFITCFHEHFKEPSKCARYLEMDKKKREIKKRHQLANDIGVNILNYEEL